jgi:hypothetical protein
MEGEELEIRAPDAVYRETLIDDYDIESIKSQIITEKDTELRQILQHSLDEYIFFKKYEEKINILKKEAETEKQRLNNDFNKYFDYKKEKSVLNDKEKENFKRLQVAINRINTFSKIPEHDFKIIRQGMEYFETTSYMRENTYELFKKYGINKDLLNFFGEYLENSLSDGEYEYED